MLVHIAHFLGLFGAFLGHFSDIYRGAGGHQRSLGHEKVKPHVECSSRLPSFGCFEPLLGLFWETPRPPYECSLGAARGQPSRRIVGANGGSTGVPGAKKMIFFKVVPRPLGMLKQLFLGRFEPVVARFGPWKIPKCIQNGPFHDQKWVKKWVKNAIFQK